MLLKLSALRVGFFMISVLIGTFLKFWADLHTSDTISAFLSRCGISRKYISYFARQSAFSAPYGIIRFSAKFLL